MKERPIIFSGPMVRAILVGAKTQTRRVVNPQPHAVRDGLYGWKQVVGGGYEVVWNALQMSGSQALSEYCPYGKPGDQLWVRETWRVNGNEHDYAIAGSDRVFYRADEDWNDGAGWRPSIFMPRWASRITLEVTGVRIQRLQDISEEDAKAEGFTGEHFDLAVNDFIWAWGTINGKREGCAWQANPWVWAVEFRAVKA